MPISIADDVFDELVDIALRHQVAGLAIGNLLKDRSKANLKDTLPADVKGNLSGQPTREITTRLIARAYA